MTHVGKLLKEKRQTAGLSLTQISRQTKITLAQLEAVEAGDVSYFSDDPSFYRFRALNYGRILGVPVKELTPLIEADIDQYYQELSASKQIKHEEINQGVKKKIIETSQLSRSLDIPWLSMILVIVIVLGTISFVLLKYIWPKPPAGEDLKGVGVVLPLVVKPNDAFNPIEEPDLPATTLSVKKIDANHYEVTGYPAEATLNLTIGHQTTYLWFKQNNKFLANPKSGEVYGNLSQVTALKVPLKIKPNDEVTIEIGLFSRITMALDELAIPLNQAYPAGRVKLTLVFK